MPKQTFFNLPAAKRAAIVKVALQEFTTNDYEAASISKIVADLGIAKGSFYQYFEDKLDLFQYLLDEGLRLKGEFLVQHPQSDDMTQPFVYLRWLLRIGLHFEFTYPQMANIAQRAMSGHSPLPLEWRQSVERQSIAFFGTLLTQGMAHGHIRADLDVESAGYILYAVTRDMSSHILRRLNVTTGQPDLLALFAEHETEVEAIFEALFNSLERGMSATPQP